MKNFNDGFMKEQHSFKGGPTFGGQKKAGRSAPARHDGQRGDKKFGGGKFGNKKFGGNDRGSRGGDRPEMFSATCSSCGKPCQVPFRPTGGKPVFCSDCFDKKAQDGSLGDRRGGNDRSRGDRRSDRGGNFGKPAHAAPAPNTDLREIKERLATIESRLNRLLDLVNPPKPPTKTAAPVASLSTDTAEKTPAAKVAKKAAAAPAKKVAKKVAPKKTVKKAVAKKVSKKTAKKVVKKAS